MTTKNARDFLDKELFVKRNIVTFRSLSRELGIHVNDAKNELQCYYDAVHGTDAPAVPTYLVSGEVPSLTLSLRLGGTQQSDSAMDMDLEFEEDREETDVVHQTKVLLVDVGALNEVKLQFSRIHSVHIYSLSPSRLGDAGFVCIPSLKVRQADAQGGLTSLAVSGKITGPHVKLKADTIYHNAASSSKTTLDAPVKVVPRVVASAVAEQQTTKSKASSSETKEQASTTTTLPRAEPKTRLTSGKLDWSKAKAKAKEPVVEKRQENKPKPAPNLTATTKVTSASGKQMLESAKSSKFSDIIGDGAQKQGVKRKTHANTDLESESSSEDARPSIAAAPSVLKGVVYSDDDNDDVRMLGQRRPRRKYTMTSDSETSLRAMMDIDDEHVDRASRVSKIHSQREEEEESEEETDGLQIEAMEPPVTSEDDFDHTPIVPKKRKPRKVVPVGHNGLKKRRIVKSRTTTDAKGYMQTEDYSSYESVEEEEEAEVKPRRKRSGTKKLSEPRVEEAKPKAEVKEECFGKTKVKSAPKTRGGAPKRGGLLNFFGPERGKR